MNKKMIFRILGAVASALIIVSIFLPFVNAYGQSASLWKIYESADSLYLPIMIIVFGAIGVIFFSLNIKTEFAYMSAGATAFFVVIETVDITNQGSFSNLGIGYYCLVGGTILTAIMAFLTNMKDKNLNDNAVTPSQVNNVIDQPSMIDQIDKLYNEQPNNEIEPIQPIVAPIQPVEPLGSSTEVVPIQPVQPLEAPTEVAPIQPIQPLGAPTEVTPVQPNNDLGLPSQVNQEMSNPVVQEFNSNPVVQQFDNSITSVPTEVTPVQPLNNNTGGSVANNQEVSQNPVVQQFNTNTSTQQFDLPVNSVQQSQPTDLNGGTQNAMNGTEQNNNSLDIFGK